MISRRTFLVTGMAGGAVLATAWWLRGGRGPDALDAADAPYAGLGAEAPSIIAAVVPVILAGALPEVPSERQVAAAETVTHVGRAIGNLAPAAQKELAELFALLGFAPARIALAGVGKPWAEASPEAVAGFLDRWRTSRFPLLRSAYDALHQLVLAAWYANPRSWPAIGYPGPPEI